MNAIEQLMQTFGASSASPSTAFFGTAAVGENAPAGFAEQFSAAINNAAQSNPLSKTSNNTPITSNNTPIELYALTGTDGAVISPELVSQLQAIQPIQAIRPADQQLPGEQEDGLSSPIILPDGVELVKVTPQDFAALFGTINPDGTFNAPATSGTTAQKTTAAIEDAEFLVLTMPGTATDDFHILPKAELEALFAPIANIAANAPTSTSASTVSQVAAGPIANQVPGTTPVADGQTPAADAKTTIEQPPTPQANAAVGTAENQQALKELAEKAAEAATLKSAKDQPASTNTKIQKPADIESYGVQSQQAAVTAKKTPVANALTGQANTAANNQASTNAAQGASNNQSGGQKQGKQENGPETKAASLQSAKALAATATSQQLTAAPVLALTPERIAGISEGGSIDAFSAGISGLRGEGSFLSSLSMLGGKAPPFLGGQIAKQVNLQVTRAVSNGTNEFTMRLNPNELGRVQVKMVFGANGTVSAQVMVERPETLELLQREARGLERAIEAGGHKAEPGGISFNLDTGNGESAGKAMADALQQDRHKENIEDNAANGSDGTAEDAGLNDKTDLAMLEEILSRVSPDTGLDVRV